MVCTIKMHSAPIEFDVVLPLCSHWVRHVPLSHLKSKPESVWTPVSQLLWAPNGWRYDSSYDTLQRRLLPRTYPCPLILHPSFMYKPILLIDYVNHSGLFIESWFASEVCMEGIQRLSLGRSQLYTWNIFMPSSTRGTSSCPAPCPASWTLHEHLHEHLHVLNAVKYFVTILLIDRRKRRGVRTCTDVV